MGYYKYLVVEKRGEKQNVLLIQIDRPKLNVLTAEILVELNRALDEAQADPGIGAVVLTGSEKSMAAGADFSEITSRTFAQAFKEDFPNISSFDRIRKPVVAAVNGLALGGGVEFAMMSDIAYAGTNASFGFPEVTIGTMPAGGGTQRLVRAVGKSKAMEMLLTGDRMSAAEAERTGLVSKVFPPDQVVNEAIKTAEKIAGFSKISVAMIKEAVNATFNIPLRDGLVFERRLFQSTYALADLAEAVAAFKEKRPPVFEDK